MARREIVVVFRNSVAEEYHISVQVVTSYSWHAVLLIRHVFSSILFLEVHGPVD